MKAGIKVTMEERICEGDVLIVAAVLSVGAGRFLRDKIVSSLLYHDGLTKTPLHGYRPFSVNSYFLITPYAAFNVAIISDSF